MFGSMSEKFVTMLSSFSRSDKEIVFLPYLSGFLEFDYFV